MMAFQLTNPKKRFKRYRIDSRVFSILPI